MIVSAGCKNLDLRFYTEVLHFNLVEEPPDAQEQVISQWLRQVTTEEKLEGFDFNNRRCHNTTNKKKGVS